MRRDWVIGLGAMGALAVLVGLDLLLAIVEDRGLAASHALLRGLAPARARAGSPAKGTWAAPWAAP
jgi:hypothetical protein